jgi:hypothetical protein
VIHKITCEVEVHVTNRPKFMAYARKNMRNWADPGEAEAAMLDAVAEALTMVDETVPGIEIHETRTSRKKEIA